MSHDAQFAGGIFSEFHEELMGTSIDFGAFDPARFDDELVAEAREVWLGRFHTEFRSTQIMTRFMTEVLGAGDPIDIYAGGVDLIGDEVRHAALCAGMCRALGIAPRFPDPVELEDPAQFLAAPMGERALHTAITMVAINESISYGFITDLRERCEEPTVRAVLDATVEDEEGHQDFGWVYIEKSLKRFPKSTLSAWRHLVQTTLKPHFDAARPILADLSPEQSRIDAWPDAARIQLGLYGPQRQALVFDETYREVVEPRLKSLDLLL
jgi:hypothetical protein